MSLILQRIDDARDSLAKASRYELCQLAQANGIAEISYSADLTLEEMINIFRKKGITSITIPDRPLGVYKPVVLGLEGQPLKSTEPEPSKEPETIEKPVSEMNMTEMRKEAKRRGIKMERTDNLSTLRTKLGG